MIRFLSLPDEFCSEKSRVVVLPVSFENNKGLVKGSFRGWFEILRASHHLEYFDDELNSEPFVNGIFTAPVLDFFKCSPEEMVKRLSLETSRFSDRFVVGLGGDHAVTLGFVDAFSRFFPDLSVLVLDAHCDLRYSWNNSLFSHACVSRRLCLKHKVGIVGVRSMDSSENDFLNSEQGRNVRVVKAFELSDEKLDEVFSLLSNNVFVSVDCDVFDPSFIRNTTTPEPGGLGWYDVLSILKRVFKEKNVVGCDLVEFSPNENFLAEAFSLAKLVYKMIAYKFGKL
ncbi:agmatinase [Candidatus Woesearchaeota archaeon]|nr:MAG: agmatinase [Candidatus Woesearchaeota archaeon ex4484_78]RLE47099.1 MAG: agmatinase [Candidatus Woesearchaeota archaeon]